MVEHLPALLQPEADRNGGEAGVRVATHDPRHGRQALFESLQGGKELHTSEAIGQASVKLDGVNAGSGTEAMAPGCEVLLFDELGVGFEAVGIQARSLAEADDTRDFHEGT